MPGNVPTIAAIRQALEYMTRAERSPWRRISTGGWVRKLDDRAPQLAHLLWCLLHLDEEQGTEPEDVEIARITRLALREVAG